MRKTPKLSNDYSQKGMSLVEVLVAMGIAGVVSLGVMRINENMIKGQRSIEQRSNRADFRNRLVRTLTNQASCTRTLQGLDPVSGQAFNQVWNVSEDGANSNVIFDTNPTSNLNSFGTGSTGFLKIDSFRVQGFNPATANEFTGLVNPADPSSTEPRLSGNARVIVKMAKPEGANTKLSYGGETLNFGVDVTVVVRQADNRIISCYADSNQFVQAMCTSLGGVYDSTDGRCKQVNFYTTGTVTSNVEIPFANPFSIVAENGLHASQGIYVGTGVSGPSSPIGGLQPGNHGIGVNTLIPPDGEIRTDQHITANNGNIIAAGGADPGSGPGGFNGHSGTGNIIATNDINSRQGNITAQSGNINAISSLGDTNQGNITATNAITANNGNITAVAGNIMAMSGSLSAHTTISTQGNGLGIGSPAISAINGDIVASNGNLVGNRAVFANCIGVGGTLVADKDGYTSCVPGSTSNCENRIETINGTSYVVMTSFAGYDIKRNPICKDVYWLQNECPAGQVPSMVVSGNFTSPTTLTSTSITARACIPKDDGCESKTVYHYKWIPDSDNPGKGDWQYIEYKATPANVCANGYQAPLSNAGFRCPGTMENKEYADPQPLAYGCETSSPSDVFRVTRTFNYYTCGEPGGSLNSLVNAATSKVSQRPCQLGGSSANQTYAKCYEKGGYVAFYSRAQSTLKAVSKITAWGGNSKPLEETVYEPIILKSGKEEDSYCMLPQTDIEITTGRSGSAHYDSCDTKGCKDAKAKQFKAESIRKARKCKSPFKYSRDPNNYIYYQVAKTTTACQYDSFRPCANKACDKTFCLHASVPGLTTPTIVGGDYASKSDDGSTWPGAMIGKISGSTGSGGVSGDVSSLPNTPSGYDVGVETHDTGTMVVGEACHDNDKNRFHYSEFACYAPVVGISCK